MTKSKNLKRSDLRTCTYIELVPLQIVLSVSAIAMATAQKIEFSSLNNPFVYTK